MSSWLKSLSLLLLAFLLTHCGYTLQHRLKKDFLNLQGIYVPIMTNESEEIGIERYLTDAMIRHLNTWGQVIVTNKKPGAYELKGFVSASIGPTLQTEVGILGLQSYSRLPIELQVNLSLNLVLIDPATEKTLWSGAFAASRRVPAPVNRTYSFESPSILPAITLSIAESLYPALARDIMRDVHDEMIELFHEGNRTTHF